MIYDKIENAGLYSINLQFVLDDLKNSNFIKGKFSVSEPDCFGIGLEYITQEADKASWEAHRKYLDIHIILEGEEIINLSNIDNMTPINEYQDDYQLFKGETQQSVYLQKGYFLILYPHEVHRTTISYNGNKLVRKNVYKKRIN